MHVGGVGWGVLRKLLVSPRYGAISIFRGHFLQITKNTLALPWGRGMGVFREFEEWPKSYLRNCCAMYKRTVIDDFCNPKCSFCKYILSLRHFIKPNLAKWFILTWFFLIICSHYHIKRMLCHKYGFSKSVLIHILIDWYYLPHCNVQCYVLRRAWINYC